MSLSTGSLFLWWALYEAEQSHIQQSIEQKTVALSAEITEQIEPKILALVRMARHWEQEHGLSRENWELEARLNLEDFRGYEAIAWADSTSQIRWTVTTETRTPLPPLKLDAEPALSAALEQARITGNLAITPYVDWIGGQDEFFVIVPILGFPRVPAQPNAICTQQILLVPEQCSPPIDGYIVGIFQAQTLFSTLLDDGDVQGYAVQIFGQDRQLYSHHTSKQVNNPSLLQETTITLHNLNWQLQVAPTRASWIRSQTYLPAVSLLSGLSLSWLLALAIYLAQSSDRAAKTAHTSALRLADFKFALDASSIVAITNADGIIQYVNEKFCQISHYSRAELLGQTHKIINSGHHPPDFFAHLWTTIVHGQVWHGEMCNRTKQGDLFWVDATIVPLLDDQREPIQFIAISIDITEKKLLETQFLRVQRMESLGTLAGGMAHDLNNVLSPIMMAVQLLKQKEQDEETQQWLEIMAGSAQRGADLIKQVLAFARGTEGDRIVLQLSEVLHEIKQILDETFPKDMTIHLDLADSLWPVLGDTTQLHQVFMNLCINARDAMPQGGTLAIAAKNLWIEQLDARHQPDLQPGAYVEVTVSDTGMGIPPSILDRIFEPFFTTKDFGKGTGMGLSTVMGIVKSHQGLITVSSQLHQGTQFQVYLPATQQGVQAIAPTAPLHDGQGELILVIDDETAICEMARSTLQSRHYQVITARSGADALRLYPQYGDAIGLVLVDVMMPEMDGVMTIASLYRLNPALKFVIMSGLVTNPDLSGISDATIAKILAKPFTANELSLAIRQALELG
ncbi:MULTISPECIES: ATP-binding protein [unclassified Leptolyngbya]|uniref:hybrid sensor histidine kinase/response regulator n=1 Tax=unclassified Leptolyngbya TaxID=2650499 RepID=UPI001682C688|nr:MULTISPECIES: ATP-binding protein [unclassified Leptolyngbya]MBD1913666.1 PAS domain-containing protein [Leptolyngbya sp. FACHB-8]MBD2157046.1 PAS domain-containing protein [Leptolyngbya sp. FACHB-16]